MAQIGALDPLDQTRPPALQPGGVGTPVTSPTNQPQLVYPGPLGVPVGEPGKLSNTPNASTSRYTPGCGHAITRYEVNRELEEGEYLAVLRCPTCSYVQGKMPWSDYLDNSRTPVVVA